MPYFCIYAVDRPNRLPERLHWRESHRARLRQHDHPVAVRIGGPLLGDDGQMIGTMLVIEALSRDQVDTYWASDPYMLADLFATVSITAFHWGLGRPEAAHG